MNTPTRALAPPLKAEVDSSANSQDDLTSLMKVVVKIIAIGSIIAASFGLLARLIIAHFT
jgi:hypothetical protein